MQQRVPRELDLNNLEPYPLTKVNANIKTINQLIRQTKDDHSDRARAAFVAASSVQPSTPPSAFKALQLGAQKDDSMNDWNMPLPKVPGLYGLIRQTKDDDREKARSTIMVASSVQPSTPPFSFRALQPGASIVDTRIDEAPQCELDMNDLSMLLTKVQALDLQRALLSGFSKVNFQMQLWESEKKFGYDSVQFKKVQFELIRIVQSKVLPDFGYEASFEGIREMRKDINVFADDVEVSANSEAINKLIGKIPDPETRAEFREAQLKKCKPLEIHAKESDNYQIVVGDGFHGGILVRLGEDVMSLAQREPLIKGAVVRVQLRHGNRVYYEKVSGTGPNHGWVSAQVQNKPLLQQYIGSIVCERRLGYVAILDEAVKKPKSQSKPTLPTTEDAPQTRGTGCPEEIKGAQIELTHEQALRLQNDLKNAFTSPGFQEHLQRCIAELLPSSVEFIFELQQLIFEVQRDIMLKYGFKPTFEGVADMRKALQTFEDCLEKLFVPPLPTPDRPETTTLHASIHSQNFQSGKDDLTTAEHDLQRELALRTPSEMKRNEDNLENHIGPRLPTLNQPATARVCLSRKSQSPQSGKDDLKIAVQDSQWELALRAPSDMKTNKMLITSHASSIFQRAHHPNPLESQLSSTPRLWGVVGGKTDAGLVVGIGAALNSVPLQTSSIFPRAHHPNQLRSQFSSRLRLWRVVGGKTSAGLIVRIGAALTSRPLPTRLEIGAVLEAEALDSNRMAYQKLFGDGPNYGWISTEIDGAPSLERFHGQKMMFSDRAYSRKRHCSRSRSADKGDRNKEVQSIIKDGDMVRNLDQELRRIAPSTVVKEGGLLRQQKLRVLGFHGRGSNAKIMAYQVGSLQQVLGDGVEWDFFDGDQVLPDDEVQSLQRLLNPHQDTFRTLQLLSNSLPFYAYFSVDPKRPHVRCGLWSNIHRAMEHIQKNGPFDVLIGFSEGCGFINLISAIFKDRGLIIPWRLSLFFNGHGSLDHGSNLLDTPLPIPSVMVFGRADPVYAWREWQIESHEHPLVLEHDEGHKFPVSMPRAAEIYKAIQTQISLHV